MIGVFVDRSTAIYLRPLAFVVTVCWLCFDGHGRSTCDMGRSTSQHDPGNQQLSNK